MNENNFLNSGETPSITCGGYEDEISSGKHFDECIEKSGLFEIWREVTGEMIQPLPGMNNKNHYRIDRILNPTPRLREAGWTRGLIGVELKKSSIKVGQPLSQIQDYLRCVWNSPSNIKVFLDYVFLWPLDKCGGPMASMMAQNHYGGVCLKYSETSEWYRLQFSIGEQFVLLYYFNPQRIEIQNLNVGRRTGSR